MSNKYLKYEKKNIITIKKQFEYLLFFVINGLFNIEKKKKEIVNCIIKCQWRYMGRKSGNINFVE